MAGIYFHIPFCKQACHYCNFFFTTSQRNIHEITQAMSEELKMRKSYLKDEKIRTIYFGGGTPSMLPPSDIQFLIDEVDNLFDLDIDAEITLEANPDNLTKEYLRLLKHTDVNRFSIGIQSFHEEDLRWMNRAHSAEEAGKCIDICREYGYRNFSIDLIFGVPVSDNNRWQDNIEQAIAYDPHHISCYALTVEENTALYHHIKKGRSQAPKDEATEAQFFIAHDMLTKAGYIHYEISNYAKQGNESKHNSSYWEGEKYLGIGPSAHSYDGVSRSWNIAHMVKYLDGIKQQSPEITTEVLSPTDVYNEYVMTAIRKKEGIKKHVLRENFSAYYAHFQEATKEIPVHYVVENEESYALSREGLLFADFVGSMLFVA